MTRVLNGQSWQSDYDSEQVLAKMSPQEYLKMSINNFIFFLLFFHLSVKLKKNT